jgi:diguanylate cyclase (GGDEF)-like protein
VTTSSNVWSWSKDPVRRVKAIELDGSVRILKNSSSGRLHKPMGNGHDQQPHASQSARGDGPPGSSLVVPRPKHGGASSGTPSGSLQARGGHQDVLLGAGLVGAFCIVLFGTSSALHLETDALRATTTVAGVTAAIDLCFLVLLWSRPGPWTLLSFPLLLMASDVAMGLLTEGVALSYSGFFTLAFFYVGLTQRRGTGPVLAVLAGPAWVLTQGPWNSGVGIKLILAIVIWLLLSDVLAVRTTRSRINTRRLVVQANTDALTGLASRLLLADTIEGLPMMPKRSESSLLFIDLDGFKSVNDTYGHAIGDELLVVVADRIRSTLREGDLAARLGGDEFAALLDVCDLDRATQVANRILSAVSEPITLSRGRVAVTASIGIVKIVPPATAEHVLRDADLAMYEAKSAGRHRLSIFARDMQVRVTDRLELETELRDALGVDQFEVYYQPVVHMGTGAIVGAEALLRWRHPRRGLLAPAEFLDAAERMGLMDLLGDWVLQQACTQAREWQPIDPARVFTMAVNLSVPEMFAANLTNRIERALENAELPAGLLVLEITEGVIMADATLASQRLQEVRSLGVRIAIDDFGTGYSSLAYLRELPIDILKIDQSFVAPLGTDNQAVALLRSIVAMANALVLDVIVEGVETFDQVEMLENLDCHIAQGFYFGRPASARDFGNRLARTREGRGSTRA